MPIQSKTAQTTYEQLASRRESYLKSARRAAELTIPFLFPPDGATSSSEFATPYQSVGSRGVNNLASKLLIALLPPNSPFFRLVIDRFELKKIEADPRMKTALEAGLAEVERAVAAEVETSTVRVSIFEALKQLIVSGNALLYVPKSGGVRVFRLDRYVVKRDPMGNVLCIVTKESIDLDALPADLRKLVQSKTTQDNSGQQCTDQTQHVYTMIRRKRGSKSWEVWQEINGRIVPESAGSYPLDKCPWIPLRFSKVDGEDYGRGLVEEVLGDLSSLESLSQSLVESAAAAAKVVFLVSPNGSTRTSELAGAPNGGFVTGHKDDVTTLQLDKFYDLQVVREQVVKIQRDLEQAFLLTAGATRQAERVTAEEIRAMVQELEATLGGVYSILAQELQLPLVNALMDRMADDKRLPAIPKKVVKPTIVTGLDALGRGNDLQKLDAFLMGVQQTLGPQVVQQFVNVPDYLERRATALGIDTEGLIKSPDQMAEEEQQAQMQALMAKLGPNVVNQAGQIVQNSQKAALAGEGAAAAQ